MADPTQERWLPIPGYEGHYEVSDYGRVRSVDRIIHSSKRNPFRLRGAMMTPTTRPDGYAVVPLSKSGSRQMARVNMLVLEAFVGPRPGTSHACHNDGNSTNNSLTNLRWDTVAENNRDLVRHGVHNNARKTHCPRGHEYSPENTYVTPSRPTARYCRACKRERETNAHRVL